MIAFAGVFCFIFFNNKKKGKDNQSEGFRDLKAQTFQVNGGWGYQIQKDTTVFIKQEVIPGAEGYLAFKTEQEAQKVADFVIHKLKRGIFPPGVDYRELDSLGINHKP